MTEADLPRIARSPKLFVRGLDPLGRPLLNALEELIPERDAGLNVEFDRFARRSVAV